MARIALCGPQLSGKSTLARHLRDHHGYLLVNYTDYLKELAAKALQAVGLNVSVADINREKAAYRAFLQEMGTQLGFDKGNYVAEALYAEHAHDYENVVFDNVRFPAQWDKLKGMGFKLVKLLVTAEEQAIRGKVAAEQHEAETALRYVIPDYSLPGWLSTEAQADDLLRELEDRGDRYCIDQYIRDGLREVPTGTTKSVIR